MLGLSMCDYTNDLLSVDCDDRTTRSVHVYGPTQTRWEHSLRLGTLGGWRAKESLGRDKMGSTELEGGGHFVSSAH